MNYLTDPKSIVKRSLTELCKDRNIRLYDLYKRSGINPWSQKPVTLESIDCMADILDLHGSTRVWFFFTVTGFDIAPDQRGGLFSKIIDLFCEERSIPRRIVMTRSGLNSEDMNLLVSQGSILSIHIVTKIAEVLNLKDTDAMMLFLAAGYDDPGDSRTSSSIITNPDTLASIIPHMHEQKTLRIFYCYAHEDRKFRDELDKHLGILKRLEKITVWYDREIQAGTEWEREIEQHLGASHIILLFISANFIHSDYCYGVEMQKALELHRLGRAYVIPILLRPVDWRDAPFAHLQMLPSEARPVTSHRWGSRDEAYYNVAQNIRTVVEDFIRDGSGR